MKRNLMYILLATTFWLMPFVSHAETQNATLTVENMSCATCPVVVRSALLKLDGVNEVSVSMKDKTVVVIFGNEEVSTQDLIDAVSNSGFPAKLLKS